MTGAMHRRPQGAGSSGGPRSGPLLPKLSMPKRSTSRIEEGMRPDTARRPPSSRTPRSPESPGVLYV